MKRKTKEKRKKLAKRVVYFVVVIAFVILIVLISRKPDEDEVIIKKLEFEHIGEDVYIKFDVRNPTNEQKTCLFNIKFADKKYEGYFNISAKSNKYYKTLVDMPYGKTEVRVDYICS